MRRKQTFVVCLFVADDDVAFPTSQSWTWLRNYLHLDDNNNNDERAGRHLMSIFLNFSFMYSVFNK